MNVLVCGDRNWTDRNAIRFCLEALMLLHPAHPIVVIEGECSGADRLARSVAEELGLKIIPFPADWKAHGRAAGPIRNRQMLDVGKPDMVIAFHPDISHSKGTRNMVKQAIERKIPVRIVTEGPPSLIQAKKEVL